MNLDLLCISKEAKKGSWNFNNCFVSLGSNEVKRKEKQKENS